MDTLNEEKNVATLQQTITKNVLFYKISTDSPSMLNNDERIKIIKEKFNKKKVTYNHDFKNGTKFLINEIKKDSNYFFGSICKVDDNKDPFTKFQLLSNNKEINSNDIIFNHFTYFYIDYKSLYISCIISKNIQSPDKYIADFLNSDNIGFFQIIPLCKTLKDMNKYINSFKLTFLKPTNFEPMSQIEKLDCEIKDFKIEVKLKHKGDKFIENLTNIVNKNKNSLRIASVGNEEEEFDLIKNTFSKKAKIRIPSDYEKKIDTIRLLLQTELFKAI